MPICSKDQSGFTLLELLIVVSILAIVSGGLYTMYDPMEAKALKSRSVSDFVTIDRGIRTFHAMSGSYPTTLDNLIEEGTSDSQSFEHDSEDSQSGQPLAHLPHTIKSTLGTVTLTSSAVLALRSSGLDQLQYFSTENAGHYTTGRPRHIQEGDQVAAFQSGCHHQSFVKAFDGHQTHDSVALHQQLGLDPEKCHLVLVFGLGAQASIIANPLGNNPVTFSHAPQYLQFQASSYNNYLLFFHLGSSDAPNIGTSEIFPKAKFAGIFDPFPSSRRSPPTQRS